ncbi:phosphoglycerate kinase [Candidatus Woesearchaeota archaeon]|nr:phosphoglycerate kinase [Candidatus Woesearchaeota archaeon]
MFRTIKDLHLKHKKVLVRVDFNVPLKPNGSVADDTRIKAAIPTINYLRKQKCVVILMTHLGRPNGVCDGLRLDHIAKHLGRLLNHHVTKCDDVIGPEVEEKIHALKEGDVCLLENLRFYAEEEQNDDKFAHALADLADAYINDAFSVSHRSHASVEAITHYLPSAAGFQLQQEIETMDRLLHHPKHPYIAVMGGAKVSDKIEVIRNLLKKVDAILIGGAMMFTFFRASGLKTGTSKVELEKVNVAKQLLSQTKRKLILPVDCVVAKSPDDEGTVVHANEFATNEMGLDIGPETVAIYQEILKNAKTVLWNGPVGMFEKKQFAKGTQALAATISQSKAVSIIGGGDTADAIRPFKFTYVSTGGGASLDFFAGKTLPGIKALEDNVTCFRRV